MPVWCNEVETCMDPGVMVTTKISLDLELLLQKVITYAVIIRPLNISLSKVMTGWAQALGQSLICLEGKSMTPRWGNTILFPSS